MKLPATCVSKFPLLILFSVVFCWQRLLDRLSTWILFARSRKRDVNFTRGTWRVATQRVFATFNSLIECVCFVSVILRGSCSLEGFYLSWRLNIELLSGEFRQFENRWRGRHCAKAKICQKRILAFTSFNLLQSKNRGWFFVCRSVSRSCF